MVLRKNRVLSVRGDGIRIAGGASGVIVDRNTVSDNEGRGVAVLDTASVEVTDNDVLSNGGTGLYADAGASVTNRGNLGSASGAAYEGPWDAGETPAALTGADEADQVTRRAAAWIRADAGGTVASLVPPPLEVDPKDRIFGAAVRIPAGALSRDALVTVAQTTEDLPDLPGYLFLTMPVTRITADAGELQGTATVFLPVLAGFSLETARVFRLNGNAWEEVPVQAPADYGRTFLHQRISFQVSSLGTYAVGLDLPMQDPGDPGGGGGCGLAPGSGGTAWDGLFLLLAAAWPAALRRRRRRR